MKIVIFIPVYNPDKGYLENTLKSLVKQTRKPDLVLLIDNNSLEPLGGMNINGLFPELKIQIMRHHKKISRVANWNSCLDEFEVRDYDAMKFLFVGDTLDPICLAEQEKPMIESIVGNAKEGFEVQVPLVTSGHRVRRIALLNYNMLQFSENRVLTPLESFEKAAADGNWIAGSTACPLIHRNVIGDTRFREDMEWASDWMFWTQLSEKCDVAFIHDVLVNFNMNSRKGYNQLSGTAQAAKEEEIVKHYILNQIEAWRK